MAKYLLRDRRPEAALYKSYMNFIGLLDDVVDLEEDLANSRYTWCVRCAIDHDGASGGDDAAIRIERAAAQRYRIKDTERGPEVWEVKWAVLWRKGPAGLPGRRHCLIVARNVLTGELKYFVSNRVPGERGCTLRWLLRVAFGRWSVESCFRQAKEELGLDHYEVRGWRCVHRHFMVVQLSHLFCARVRKKFERNTPRDEPLEHLTTEQVRRAMNVWLATRDLSPAARRQRFEKELSHQQYYQTRNRQAQQSHTKTRIAELNSVGIEVDRIKSCLDTRGP